MTSTVTSIIIPSQIFINGAIGGLALLLIISQLVDYEGSALKSLTRYAILFSTPLIIWFAFNIIIRVSRIIAS